MRGLLLILLLALQPVTADPEVSIPVGPSARLTTLPRLHEHVVELMVYEVEGDLSPLKNVSSPQISELDVRSHGSGTWLVKMYLTDAGTHLVPTISDGHLSLSVLSGAEPPRPPVPGAPSLESLLDNSAVARPPEPLPRMMFLNGEALSAKLQVADYPLRLGEPDWLEADRGGWRRLEDERLAFLRAEKCGPPCAKERAEALHQLGWRYLEMGWDTEGRHYIEQLPPDDAAAIAPLEVARSRARAAIETQDWDAARVQLGAAWAQGADIAEVTEGLAIVSLESGVPARAPTGRLLANVTAAPHAQLLAAQLLQIDGQFDETIPILDPLLDTFEAAEDTQAMAQAALRLGDAFLLRGKIDEARRAWQRADEPLRMYRAVYAELYRAGAANWVAAIPMLHEWSRDESELSAEAAYLIAQIDEGMGIEVDAIESYGRFIDDHRSTARHSDAPQRLWTLYSRRARRLAEGKEWYVLAALHEAAWRDMLYEEIDDPTVMWDVAKGYEALGLHRKALDVLSTGFAKLVSEGRTHPEMILHLAELYEHLDNPRDGLKTLDFLRSQGIPDEQEGAVALMSGRMLYARGQQAEAIQQLRLARREPALRDEADLFLARIDAEAGRCDRAVPPMRRLLLTETGLLRWTESAPYLELTRCAAAIGQRSLAAEAALAASERATSPTEARYAGFLHQLYSDPTQLPEVLSTGEDIWQALGAERSAEATFQASLDERLKP